MMKIYRCRYKTKKGERETQDLTKSQADKVCRISKKHDIPCKCRVVKTL